MLISAAALQRLVQEGGGIVFDCRHDLASPDAGARAYALEHIPGARFLHLDRDLSGVKTGRNGRHPLPDAQVLAETLAAAGVSRTTQVVACDDHGGMFAARLWWLLRWLGHENVAVLDGGLSAWRAAGGEQVATLPEVYARGDFAGVPRGEMIADADCVLRHLNDSGALIIDARSPDRFRGENETLDPVGGYIPGARNRFFRDNLAADGCFKDAASLREEFARILAGHAPDSVISQCGSGVTACHNLLAMEIAGLHVARLYPGSWSEWCADSSRPLAQGGAQPS